MLKPDQWALAPNHASTAMLAAGTKAIMTARIMHADRCWQAMWKVMRVEAAAAYPDAAACQRSEIAQMICGFRLRQGGRTDTDKAWKDALETADRILALCAQSQAPTAVFMTKAQRLLDLAEEAEDKALIGDEGCVWPVEALRHAYVELSSLATASMRGAA